MNWTGRLFNAFRRRSLAGRFKEFAANVASPFALGTKSAGQSFNAYTMPAAGRLWLKSTANQAAGKITVNGVALPALTANVWYESRYFEENETITIALVSGSSAATISLGVATDWEKPTVIATGTAS